MAAKWFGGRLVVLGAALAVGAPLTMSIAEAARTRSGHFASSGHVHARAIQVGMSYSHGRSGHSYSGLGRRAARWGYSGGGGGLQCVPFARENTGIELSGNANTWWDAADGVYQRGARPEVGSVLNFRATGHMRMGHVAVVSNVVNPRTIEIDHANWGRGRISRNMTVVDVSPLNDWTAVRVEQGFTGDYGSIYPTYGFIYDRPDKGTMVANTGTMAVPVLNAAPSDLRPAAERLDPAATEVEEVAEAMDDSSPHYYRSGRRSYRHTSAHVHSSNSVGSNSGAHVIRTSSHSTTLRSHSHRHRS